MGEADVVTNESKQFHAGLFATIFRFTHWFEDALSVRKSCEVGDARFSLPFFTRPSESSYYGAGPLLHRSFSVVLSISDFGSRLFSRSQPSFRGAGVV